MAQPADLAVLGLVIDASGAIKGIQAAEGKLLSLEQSFGKVQKAAAVAFGAGLGIALGVFVKNTIDAEREVAALESRIKSTGGVAGFTAEQLVRIGGELQRVSTFSGGAIAGMQELLLTFTNVRGDNFTKASQAILNMATVMGGDLKGAAIQLGKALNDPILGVSALSKAGVQMTESQKETIKQMVALNDIAGAQTIILGELETQFGGAAEAARNTLGGALIGLKEAFGDLFESPDSVEGMAEAINTVTDNIKTATRTAVVFGATLATALFSGAVASAFASIIAQLKALNVAIGISTVAAQGLRAVLATMGGPWVAGITAAVLALGSAWVYFSAQADKAANASNRVLDELGKATTENLEARFSEKLAEIAAATGKLEQMNALVQSGAGPSDSAIQAQRQRINALEQEANEITKVLHGRKSLTQAQSQASGVNQEAINRANESAAALRKQREELAKLRKEFSLRSTSAMDMSGAGTADLTEQIREREEYTEAVKKGADLELRMLIALTQAREEYRKALDGTGASGLPLMAGPQATTQVVIEPAEGSLSKFQEFFGWLATEAGLVTDNLGSAFATTFQNIAARGKVAFGDLFNTIAGLFKAGSGGASIFGALGIGASVVGGAMANRNAEVEQAKATREQFQKEITAFNEMLSRWATDIGGYATDLDAAIESVNRTFDDQSRQLRDIFDAANKTINVDTAKNLEAYNKAYAALVKLRDDEIKRITELNEKKKAEFADDMAIRSLLVAGLDDQAALMRLEIAQAKELAEAKRLGIDITELEILQQKEKNKLAEQQKRELERQERELGFTIGGLDAAIAREMGNTDAADAIERDIERQRILAEVTDATVRAKYEELFALQDTNRALDELKKAAELVAEQQMRSEDLEVRRLMATGKTMEAEELRFQLEQARELKRAEGELARGEITQEIFDQLREVLGLEKIAFSNRNQGATDPAGAGAASASRGGTGQLSNLATAQVQDIDRVVGELTTIRVRAGQLVQLMTALVRGGGILGAVNAGIQGQTQNQSLLNGNLVVS